MSEPLDGSVAEGAIQTPEFADLSVSTPGMPLGALGKLRDVPVELVAELGQVRLTLSELSRLAQGSVVALERALAEPVELRVQGVRVGLGEIVVVGDRFGIRIQSLDVDGKA